MFPYLQHAVRPSSSSDCVMIIHRIYLNIMILHRIYLYNDYTQNIFIYIPQLLVRLCNAYNHVQYDYYKIQ